MAWSTREIAELAGTSLRSVRHYHQVGLLPEPERRSNGYKQYGVAHLIRLLRIKRLVDLGFSLAQIADLGDRDEHPSDELRALDADLAARIESLQRVRAELAETLADGLATDLPAEFAKVPLDTLSASDRSMASVMGRLLGEGERVSYARLLTDETRSESERDFDTLPADADEATREALAVRMVTEVLALRERHPGVFTLGASDRARFQRTVEQVSDEVYSPVQVDVLRRMRTLFVAAVRAEGPG